MARTQIICSVWFGAVTVVMAGGRFEVHFEQASCGVVVGMQQNPPAWVRPSSPRTPPGQVPDHPTRRRCCQAAAVFAEVGPCQGTRQRVSATLARASANAAISCSIRAPGARPVPWSVPGRQGRGEEVGEQLGDPLMFVVMHPVRGVGQALDVDDLLPKLLHFSRGHGVPQGVGKLRCVILEVRDARRNTISGSKLLNN